MDSSLPAAIIAGTTNESMIVIVGFILMSRTIKEHYDSTEYLYYKNIKIIVDFSGSLRYCTNGDPIKYIIEYYVSYIADLCNIILFLYTFRRRL
jgi:hypothetical protein